MFWLTLALCVVEIILIGCDALSFPRQVAYLGLQTIEQLPWFALAAAGCWCHSHRKGRSCDRHRWVICAVTWLDAQSLPAIAEPLAPKIAAIAEGSFKKKHPPAIRGTGYAVDCLAALWAFYGTDNFRDAVLAAANLGEDADTTAAVCGQIAGACYGTEAIPQDWLDKLAMRDTICSLASKLIELW